MQLLPDKLTHLPQHARRGQDAGARAARRHQPSGNDDTFVIQEHHATPTALRLPAGAQRRAGVAGRCRRTCPRRRRSITSPCTPRTIRWSTPTFEGSIPKGEYGGGKVIVWDSGTYETEKFSDDSPDGPAKGGEVIVTLHGSKIDGRYALIQTDGKNWLAHRMKEQPTLTAEDMAPMLATHGSVEKLKAAEWAFEGKWDGYRLLVDADHGELESAFAQRTRRHRRVSRNCRRWPPISPSITSSSTVKRSRSTSDGVPNFGADAEPRALDADVEFWAFDILALDGRSLLRAKYSDRRRMLEALADGGGLIVPDQLPGDGPEALEYARKHRWEGVVAKKRDSTYQPGRRSRRGSRTSCGAPRRS